VIEQHICEDDGVFIVRSVTVSPLQSHMIPIMFVPNVTNQSITERLPYRKTKFNLEKKFIIKNGLK